jgi:hypothetical protein
METFYEAFFLRVSPFGGGLRGRIMLYYGSLNMQNLLKKSRLEDILALVK